ncbi:hypothetical protein BGX27_005251 [Mortierella sp. AM989]|nr:hypothetical protein BGX27_005251 [Mortierella sp. AM989]
MEGIKVKKEPVEVKKDPDDFELNNRLDIKGDGNEETEEEGSDDGEDVYEVERVVGHMKDPVLGLRYQLKWKGYSDNENTYEPEGSVFCHGLVNEYWERYLGAGGKKTDPEGHDPKPQPQKRKAVQQQQQGLVPDLDSVLGGGSSSTSTTKTTHQETKPSSSESTLTKASTKGAGHRREDGKETTTPSKKQKISSSSENEVGLWTPPSSWASWDSHIDRVDAVEQRHSDGSNGELQLIVHILWKDGKRSEVPSKLAHKKCPQKLLDFYEGHLLFQEEDTDM